MKHLLVALMLAFWPCLAAAEIPGEDDPRYLSARAAWLSGEDEIAALRVLVELANEDNTAAQMLLGRVHWQEHWLFPNVSALSREDRNEIFYKKSRGHGRSWTSVAAEANPLAALLLTANVENFEARSRALADADLKNLAIDYAQIALNASGDHLVLARAFNHPNLTPITRPSIQYAMYLAEGMLEYEDTPEKRAAFEKVQNSLPPLTKWDRMLVMDRQSFIPHEDLHQAKEVIRARGALLLTHPRLEPLAAVVRDTCSDDPAYTMGLLFQVKESLALGRALVSPFAPLISDAEWHNAARFQQDVRNILVNHPRHHDILQKLSPCIATTSLPQK